MAVGKAGENIVVDKLVIKFGEIILVKDGKVVENYNEDIVKEYMRWDSIEINIELNMGNGAFTAYTCDFTKDYIDINADYRN